VEKKRVVEEGKVDPLSVFLVHHGTLGRIILPVHHGTLGKVQHGTLGNSILPVYYGILVNIF
jgi:hypothetical protein